MSLRLRVLAGMTLIALVLVAAGGFVAATTKNNLVGQIDAQLLSARMPRRPPGGSFGSPAPQPNDSSATQPERVSAMYVGVVDADGTVETIFKPNNVDDPPLPALQASVVRAHADSGRAFTTAADSGHAGFRAVAVADAATGDVIVSALSLAGVERSTRQLVAVEVGATGLVLALLAAVTWWVVRLGVRPIKRMTAAAATIAAGDLSERVPEVRSKRTEVGELGVALNDMLHNIEGAMDQRRESEDRLRQFIADASHELRTPVATIRGYAELYRGGALGDDAQLQDAMRRTEEEAVRMATLIDDMLHLARLDQGRPLENEPVDLAVLARDAAQDARAVAPAREVAVDVDAPLVVIGDDHRLRQVVTNVVRNALIHTPDATPVEVRAQRADRWAVLEVADHGPGMAPEVARQAFDRFYRGDTSRSRARGGSGLGLAIVNATVHALGGEVHLDTAEGKGTTVRIRLPLADGSQPSHR